MLTLPKKHENKLSKPNLFQLGDPKTATADEVREAFRRLIQQHHPDHGGDPRVAERLQTMKDSILALMP